MIDVPKIVDTLLASALDTQASDIHIQPYPDQVRIRFRIDGLLYDRESFTKDVALPLIARIKVLSQLDVAERRRPQDGTFSYQTSDIRVATFPTIHGEKLVLRLLDKRSSQLSLGQLGLSPGLYERIIKLVFKEQGFFLVTGPTGSGKTTTVHALLSTLNAAEKNIVTLEDPVEYTLAGISQSAVHPQIGLTFESGLRSLLRQDPDVIMVGEIRDPETAQVALQAALTGHQVFSTLHTSDAPGALMRLVHMGCERYLLAAGVTAILAQRLLRRLCASCRFEMRPTKDQIGLLERFGKIPDTLYEARGCEACKDTGYAGRIGVFQLLELNSSLRGGFIVGSDYDQLCELAYREGMGSLVKDGFDKLYRGEISYNEWLRIP